MTRMRQAGVHFLAACLCFSGLLPSAQAGWVSTQEVVAAAPSAAPSAVPGAAREQLAGLLDRAEVAAALQARGVDASAARERVAALSDAQAAQLLAQIDSAPAGGDGVLGTVVFIFVLLLITDILGFTKVFPFTRSVR